MMSASSSIRSARLLTLFLVACFFFEPIFSVKRENFKTCDQSGFCRRNRAYADAVSFLGDSWSSPYTLDRDSIEAKDGKLTANLRKTLNDAQSYVDLPVIITFLGSGIARITIDEARRQAGDIELRHGSNARKERYNEVSEWALASLPNQDRSAKETVTEKETVVAYGPDGRYKAVIQHQPFSIQFLRDDEVHVKLNGNGLLNYEHWRPKLEKEKKETEGEESKTSEETPAAAEEEETEDETTWWEESFGGNTDSKPKGPESVGIDITFPNYEHVFGIPEHTGPLSLKETRGGTGAFDQPYRFYNADVFEYEMDSPMTLYGAIPLMYAHRKKSSVGVFWMNAAETWIDIIKQKQSSNPLSLGIGAKSDTKTHWFSESGLIDLFVFLGPEPKDILQQYTKLTGFPQLPPSFSTAYHQCRWNYVSDEDVKDVDKKMSHSNIPYDVIWLDIEYANGKKYFTWDPDTFPNSIEMQKHLDASERKLVVIIDPHIKNEGGYHVSDQLKSQDLAVKNKDGAIYDGWCWPGSSNWVDCFSPAARKWYRGLYTYKSFTGTSPNVHLWNDMNEPSVFNGPETTMPKDNLHYGNWEHRDVHNVNGLTFHNATYEALLARDSPAKRPFVLTRSFYAGSQRTAAMWTGDNQASWDHLAASIPMILSLNIAGLPFAGADVGGFFGNPSKELLTRWYQAGAFYPFFRAHAHIDTRRREPYLIGSPHTEIVAQAIRLRYQLLPTFYTAFHTAHTTGLPILRPNYFAFPDDEAGFTLDDQFYLADTGLLVKPIVTEGATTAKIYLTSGNTYFDYFTYVRFEGASKAITVPAPIESIPVLMQAGHIFPRKDRPRRSSGLMKWDPYTLVMVLDDNGKASGELYADDGETFDYQSGAFIHRKFDFDAGALTSTPLPNPNAGAKIARKYVESMKDVVVEKVVIVNAPKSLQGLTEVDVLEGSKERKVGFEWIAGKAGAADWAVVKNPKVRVGEDWRVRIQEASKKEL